jgi:hypothetical protein
MKQRVQVGTQTRPTARHEWKRRKTMDKLYVVVDPEGNTSFDNKTADQEKFRSFKAARSRAEELAKDNPGETIGIYELTAEAIVPVMAVEVFRAHPLEHYK